GQGAEMLIQLFVGQGHYEILVESFESVALQLCRGGSDVAGEEFGDGVVVEHEVLELDFLEAGFGVLAEDVDHFVLAADDHAVLPRSLPEFASGAAGGAGGASEGHEGFGGPVEG